MKKIVLILISFFSIEVFAQTFFEPEWKEFCPQRYSNVSTDRWHYTNSGRYWSERRKNFEKRLEICKNLSSETKKNACFENLRLLENNESQLLTQEAQARALKKMFINSMF